MIEAAFPWLLLVTTVGSGLMAGLFCSFSCFMMQALGSLPPAKGAAAMQAINEKILTPSFLSVFMGTTALSIAMIILGVMNLGSTPHICALVGGASYFFGCFVVTPAKNIPLNDRLAAVDAESPEGAEVWAEYLRVWTRWNHVRSAATLVSTTVLSCALLML